jgi:subtilisin-like proprotein convertase family protein
MKKFYMYLILCLVIRADYIAAQPQTFTGDKGAGGLGYIPDYPAPAVTFTCGVTGIGAIKSYGFVNLKLNITHQFAESDLDITLTSPEGTVLTIYTGDEVTFAADFSNTVFNQTATENVQDGAAPFAGEYLPKETPPGLAKFDGENADGNWTLTIFDKAPIGDGTLNSWSLSFDKNVGNVKPEAAFSYTTDNLNVFFNDLSTNFPASWRWDFGDGDSSSIKNPNHSYAASGTYDVRLIATNSGGSDTATQSVTVSDPAIVKPVFRLSDAKIYPNPGRGKIFIELPNIREPVRAEVLNMIGNKVKYVTLTTAKSELDLGNLQKGIYFIKLYLNNTAVMRKIQITD